MPKVIQVIESHIVKGNGKDDPYRTVIQYHSLDGDFLAQNDSDELESGMRKLYNNVGRDAFLARVESPNRS